MGAAAAAAGVASYSTGGTASMWWIKSGGLHAGVHTGEGLAFLLCGVDVGIQVRVFTTDLDVSSSVMGLQGLQMQVVS